MKPVCSVCSHHAFDGGQRRQHTKEVVCVCVCVCAFVSVCVYVFVWLCVCVGGLEFVRLLLTSPQPGNRIRFVRASRRGEAACVFVVSLGVRTERIPSPPPSSPSPPSRIEHCICCIFFENEHLFVAVCMGLMSLCIFTMF